MSEQRKGAPGRRGRPRSADVDRAVTAATIELLAEQGYAKLTIEAVAARAGVGRPAVYRRWPTKDDLAVHALVEQVPPLAVPDTGDVLRDLKELSAGFALRLAGSPLGRTVLAVHAEAGRRPDLAEALRHHYLNPRNATIRALIERGLAEGRLNPALAPDTVRDLVFGPLIYHWLVTGHLSTATANTIADAACAAVSRTFPSPDRAGGSTDTPGRP
ncbi:TetR/AcrR family transcriptional regulator [Actinomadura sp. NPDC048021]|uniref:TetR/AcrR family transcriptional regulator n=1 Tax=Actinomadura sp. NPDC048021 TaxID=3155385 RepID=UPI0034031E92